MTLAGGGVLLLSDNGANQIYGAGTAGDTLLNLDDTIAGAGQIGVNAGTNALALVNDAGGTIDATSAVNALVIQTGGPAVINAGLIEATGAGGLQIANATTLISTATGELLAAGGVITLQSGADIVGGTLAATGGGAILTNNATLDGSGSLAVTIAAATGVTVENQTPLTLLGTLNLLGTLSEDDTSVYLYATEIIVATPTVTLTGGGLLQLSDNPANQIYGASTGDTLVNAGDTIAGGGAIGINSASNPLGLVNQAGGIIDATGSNPLVIQTGGPIVTNAGADRGDRRGRAASHQRHHGGQYRHRAGGGRRRHPCGECGYRRRHPGGERRRPDRDRLRHLRRQRRSAGHHRRRRHRHGHQPERALAARHLDLLGTLFEDDTSAYLYATESSSRHPRLRWPAAACCSFPTIRANQIYGAGAASTRWSMPPPSKARGCSAPTAAPPWRWSTPPAASSTPTRRWP